MTFFKIELMWLTGQLATGRQNHRELLVKFLSRVFTTLSLAPSLESTMAKPSSWRIVSSIMLYKKLYVYKTALRERAIRHQSTAPGRRDEIFSIRSIRSLKSQLVKSLPIKKIPLTDISITPGYSWMKWQESRQVGLESDTRNQYGDVNGLTQHFDLVLPDDSTRNSGAARMRPLRRSCGRRV